MGADILIQPNLVISIDSDCRWHEWICGDTDVETCQYFNMETDSYETFFASSGGENGMCWTDKEHSSNCCPILKEEDGYILVEPLQSLPDDSSISEGDGFCPAEYNYSSNDDGSITFTNGNHTHIIHPDYRCSNNLCWEPGGDRNCYDADEWYEIRNGDIHDFVRYRSREEMCAEVYSAGSQGGAYTPPAEEIIKEGDSDKGQTNDMRIISVSASKGAHSERKRTIHFDPGEKFYAYAKLGNTGSAQAEDFKVKFYVDGGKKNFNQDDEDYKKSVRVDSFPRNAEIRYSREITAPEQPGTYYLYAAITSLNDDEDESNNKSKEGDKDHYAKLIIDCVDAEERDVNLVASNVSWTEPNRNFVYEGEKFKIGAYIRNTGTETPCVDSRLSYQIELSPNDWLFIDGDTVTPEEMAPNAPARWEQMNKTYTHAPKAGTYQIRACADQGNKVPETDEEDNCTYNTLVVRKRPHPPTGHLDGHNCTTFWGWARDPDTTKPIWLHIYKDGKYFAGTPAKWYRGDLPYADKQHGFTYHPPISIHDGKTHQYKIFAIDNNGQSYNKQIAKFNMYCTNHRPEGYFEHSTCDMAYGWARDANTTDPIDVHLYVNGVFAGSAKAHHYRGDLPFPDKNHGFAVPLPHWAKTGHQVELKVYGINVPTDHHNNTLLGVKHITCR